MSATAFGGMNDAASANSDASTHLGDLGRIASSGLEANPAAIVSDHSPVMSGSAVWALVCMFAAGALFAWLYATTPDPTTASIGLVVGVLGTSAVGLAINAMNTNGR